MTHDILNLILAAIIACGMIIFGMVGARKKDRYHMKQELRQAAYILSICEIATGVIGLVGCALFYYYWLR